MCQKGESMNVETDKIDGKNIYIDEHGFLHDAKAEKITVADYVRKMQDDDLADMYVAFAKVVIQVVLEKQGLCFCEEDFDEAKAKILILDYLRKDVSEIMKK